MELASDFSTFLSKIRLTEAQRTELRDGHALLRRRLRNYEPLNHVLVSDFLQGSYRRHTAVRPKNESRADIDVVVVTSLSEADYAPAKAMDLFIPFLEDHYADKWRRQGRSLGIELSAIDFDLVITSAPSESQAKFLKSEAVTTDDNLDEAVDWRLHPSWLGLSTRVGRVDALRLLAEAKSEPEWKTEPLRIPDRAADKWDDTHPLEQMRWTRDKNKITSGHFVNVVRCLKWWRLERHPQSKHPKGFPLERIVGDCCPDGIGSVAEGIVVTLENFVQRYKPFANANSKPILPDYGVPNHDVLSRLSEEDFLSFCSQAESGAVQARLAFDSQDRSESRKMWRELLGSRFPEPSDEGGSKRSGYSPPEAPAEPRGRRFA